MFTLYMWKNYDLEINDSYYYNRINEKSNEELALLLMIIIVLTPVTLLLDTLILPIELFYLICLKIIEKKRRNY